MRSLKKISERLLRVRLSFVRTSGREDHKIMLGMCRRHRTQKRERVLPDSAWVSSRQMSGVHAYAHRWV